jgi:hypothetical protein
MKIRNFLLKTNTALCAGLFTITSCMVDSESIIPTILCVFSLAWLILFYIANEERIERKLKR